MRVKGIPVPANVLLISLNTSIIYKYNSQDFLKEIETIYIGASSKNNDISITHIEPETINYSTDTGSARLIEILREEKYTKINLDEDCILGWAEKFYREHPKAQKGDFIGDNEGLFPKAGEIREPLHFKYYIIPYTGKSNEKFKYLMDCLNDKLKKKELGAFYTPIPYCKKAVELVREAIKAVPKCNDYVIIDRCAGTGNLESVLNEDELKHCVLSTFEYYEYKVLIERLGDRVKYIIPPTESEIKYREGNVLNADAMSEEYVNNEYLQGFVKDEGMTIILLENPPYRDDTTGDKDSLTKRSYTTSFIKEEMKKEVKGAILNDISNRFIWSGFKYYLRQPTDSYILFSPVKYFKSCNLSKKTFKDGFIFNRKYFHASASAISCILWQNIEKEQENFILKAFDIELDLRQNELQEQLNNGKLSFIKDIEIKKVYKVFSEVYYDKRIFSDDEDNNIWSGRDGYENKTGKIRIKSIFNKNILGYILGESFTLDPLRISITRCVLYNGNGFYLRSDNFLTKLPLFCAKLYPQENWYEKDIYFTTADGGDKYTHDTTFLNSCLIYTCLSRYNKCLSFTGSDDRNYKNELCFEKGTLACDILEKIDLNNYEKKLLELWNVILSEGKKCKEYNKNIVYGVYQIEQELNTFYKNDRGENVYNYPELNGKLKVLKTELKGYYKGFIEGKLFEYELLK